MRIAWLVYSYEMRIYVAFLRCATIFLLTYVYVRSRRKASHALNCSHISILTVTESVLQAFSKDKSKQKTMGQVCVQRIPAHFYYLYDLINYKLAYSAANVKIKERELYFSCEVVPGR